MRNAAFMLTLLLRYKGSAIVAIPAQDVLVLEARGYPTK